MSRQRLLIWMWLACLGRLVDNVSALASATMVDESWMHLSMRLWLYAQILLRAVMLHFRSLLTVMATLRECGLMVVLLAGMGGGLLLRMHCKFLSVSPSWTVMAECVLQGRVFVGIYTAYGSRSGRDREGGRCRG